MGLIYAIYAATWVEILTLEQELDPRESLYILVSSTLKILLIYGLLNSASMWFMFVLNWGHHIINLYWEWDAGCNRCNRWMHDMTVFASMTCKTGEQIDAETFANLAPFTWSTDGKFNSSPHREIVWYSSKRIRSILLYKVNCMCMSPSAISPSIIFCLSVTSNWQTENQD